MIPSDAADLESALSVGLQAATFLNSHDHLVLKRQAPNCQVWCLCTFVAQTVTIGEQKVSTESEPLKFFATPTHQVENPSDSTALDTGAAQTTFPTRISSLAVFDWQVTTLPILCYSVSGTASAHSRDERSYIFQIPTSLVFPALRLLLRLQKFLKHQLRHLLTLRKFPSNSYQKDSVYFASWGKIYVVVILPLIEQKRLKWSCDKHNAERHNTLRFRVMV